MEAPALRRHRAATINDLPDEILFDVFLRLPLRSCIRCRCVSKRWRALVSSPMFGRLYVSPITFFKENCVRLWSPEVSGRDDLEIPHRPSFISDSEHDFTWFPFLNIFASRNDLLFGHVLARKFTFGIFNPFTRQLVELPLDEFRGASYMGGATGFILKQNKIVVIRFFKKRKCLRREHITVYGRKFSSETGQWTNVLASCPPPRDISLDLPLIAHNDKLYWLAVKGVVEYDPLSDLWNLFDLSYASATPLCHGIVGFCDESMRVAVNSEDDLRIWELKKDPKTLKGEWEWNMEHRIRLGDLVFEGMNIALLPSYDSKPIYPLSFHPYDRDIVYLVWRRDHILLYNLQHKTLQFLHKLPPVSRQIGAFLLQLPWWPTGPSQIPTNEFIVANTETMESFVITNTISKCRTD